MPWAIYAMSSLGKNRSNLQLQHYVYDCYLVCDEKKSILKSLSNCKKRQDYILSQTTALVIQANDVEWVKIRIENFTQAFMYLYKGIIDDMDD